MNKTKLKLALKRILNKKYSKAIEDKNVLEEWISDIENAHFLKGDHIEISKKMTKSGNTSLFNFEDYL